MSGIITPNWIEIRALPWGFVGANALRPLQQSPTAQTQLAIAPIQSSPSGSWQNNNTFKRDDRTVFALRSDHLLDEKL